ncbi:hypothetical protein HY227_00605 [Candidatus Wolfebacteria bacterium]|nr:hypothetical protein [Candidatus Wolfebacteria bacterium]
MKTFKKESVELGLVLLEVISNFSLKSFNFNLNVGTGNAELNIIIELNGIMPGIITIIRKKKEVIITAHEARKGICERLREVCALALPSAKCMIVLIPPREEIEKPQFSKNRRYSGRRR